MKVFNLSMALVSIAICGGVSAQGNPATVERFEPDQGVELFSETSISRYTRHLDNQWKEFLQNNELQQGPNEGDLYVSSGSEVVSFPVEHPGFLEARAAAYSIAFLRAKVEMIRFLGSTGSRELLFDLAENAAFERGVGAEEAAYLRQAERILKKEADLTERQLDAELRDLDPEYNPDQYTHREAKEDAFRQSYQEKLRAQAAQFVAGATPLKVYEGFSGQGEEYEVLVGLVWSPKLARLAGAVGDSVFPMPAREAGQRVDAWLPRTLEALIPSWGVHRLANEHGEQTLVAFGQAAPRSTAPTRRRRAQETAIEVASLRAEGEIRAFVGETTESFKSLEGNLVLREYAIAAEGATIDRGFVEEIRAVTEEVELKGLRRVAAWIVEHPAAEREVAIAAVAWSPEGVALADRVRAAIETRRRQPDTPTRQDRARSEEKDRTLGYERQNVDLNSIR